MVIYCKEWGGDGQYFYSRAATGGLNSLVQSVEIASSSCVVLAKTVFLLSSWAY